MTISPKTYEPVACILCGSAESEPITHTGQFGWPTHVSICNRCGLVYLNPRWTKEDTIRFYETEYDQFYRYEEGEAAEKEQRKAQVVWDRLRRFTPHNFRSALDIGCGLGWNLHHIRQQLPGLAIAGIEPSEQCAAHFTGEIGGELIASDVDTPWHLDHPGQYDLIVMRHVLEHMLDPVAVLNKIHHSLSPQGYAYIAVPDMMHPDGSLANFWFRCVHTYYFSAPTLSRAAALAGLEPVALREENAELWAIFRRGETGVPALDGRVADEQKDVIKVYRRKRAVRSLIRRFNPQKISRFIPRQVKALVPASLRARFRSLVYRH
jgi:SAM-dependent methyltransferase